MRQLFESLSRGPVLTVLIIISFAAGLTLSMGSLNYYTASSQKLTGFYTAYSDDEYRFYLHTVYNPNEERDLDEIKTDIKLRAESSDFDFYFIGDADSVAVADYRGPDSCLSEFGEMLPKRNESYDAQTGSYLSEVSAIQLSGNVFEKFALRCAVGEDYSQYNTFCPVSGTEIPVVIGCELREAYDIGDTFIVRILTGTNTADEGTAAENIFIYLTCRVSGILEKNSVLIDPNPSGFDNDGYIHLDYMIIMPTLDWVSYFETEQLDSPILLLAEYQTQGVAVTSTSQFNFVKYFSERGVENISAMLCMRVNASLIKDADAYFDNLTAAGLLILVCTSVCLAINLSNKLLSQIKTYSVHLISGATLTDVNIFLIAEAAFIALISELLAVAASMVFSDDIFTFSVMNIFSLSAEKFSVDSVLLMVATGTVIIVLALIMPLVKLNNTEFDTLLRGRE